MLRFARLFGYGKASHQPKIWKHVKRKRKKRLSTHEDATQSSPGEDYGFYGSDEGMFESPESEIDFPIVYGAPPTEEQCAVSDEVGFC